MGYRDLPRTSFHRMALFFHLRYPQGDVTGSGTGGSQQLLSSHATVPVGGLQDYPDTYTSTDGGSGACSGLVCPICLKKLPTLPAVSDACHTDIPIVQDSHNTLCAMLGVFVNSKGSSVALRWVDGLHRAVKDDEAGSLPVRLGVLPGHLCVSPPPL